jgi:5'(3')-deoxyribonucleotidase
MLMTQDFWAHFAFEEFWANLKWTPEGQGLLKYTEEMVGQENIGLLTTPMDIAGCIEGKRQWIKKNLPEYSKQLIVTPAKYLLAGPKKILVDDHDPNITKFVKSHPRVCRRADRVYLYRGPGTPRSIERSARVGST